MTRLTIAYVEAWIGFGGALVALAAYLLHARPWHNPVAWFLTTLDAAVCAWYGFGLLYQRPRTGTGNLVEYGVIAALMLFWAVTWLIVIPRRQARRTSE